MFTNKDLTFFASFIRLSHPMLLNCFFDLTSKLIHDNFKNNFQFDESQNLSL